MTRANILRKFGANDKECQELLKYNQHRFTITDEILKQTLPLTDEGFVQSWQGYLEESASSNRFLFSVLQEKLPQLAFPVETGISKTVDYKNATLRGYPTSKSARGLPLEQPNDLTLKLHQSPAGKIPVLTPGSRHDFELMVQALSGRNEPIAVPASMGACMVSGFNNWDRVKQYKKNWQAQNPALEWEKHFPDFIKQKDLFRDRFIILSQGSYSNIFPAELSFTNEQWTEKSTIIRLAHECTHYLTLRLLGSMQNNLFDEIIADFVGICTANDGKYNAAWFLEFMGLESENNYREGGRLENYHAEVAFSARTFEILQTLVRAAASNLQNFYNQNSPNHSDISHFILAIASCSLEEIASSDAVELLNRNLQRIEKKRSL